MLDCGQNRDSCLYKGKDSEFGVQIIEVSVGEINASFMKVKVTPQHYDRRYPFMHLGEERQCGVKFIV